ncbi:MAG: CPBP family intramembrane metalloprotease [Verrucomicrobiae bacterium]|nr:CPBP family intramembrane metalloprotease [Verrucomicrobiae bacterium]
MKPWRALALYLAVVIVFSTLTAPWVYALLQCLARSPEGPGVLGAWEFREVLNRVLLLSAIAGAVILLRLQNSLTLETLGLARSPLASKHLLLGACVAGLSVVVVMLVGFVTGAFQWDRDLTVPHTIQVGLVTLLIAGVVAVSEEFFFRGCLLGWLRQRTPVMLALVVVTCFYAICHFMNVPKSKASHSEKTIQDEVRWNSGVEMIARYGERLAQDSAWVQRFAMLVFVGLALGWCFLKTSRLYLSIGLHGGWVFAGKMMTFLTDTNRVESNWWFGYGKTIGSPITIVVVASVFVFMTWICRQPIIRGASRQG